MELLAQSEDRPIQLRVLNAKTQTTRELQLTPSRKWPGKGLIGVTIRFDSYEGVEDQLVHVLVRTRHVLFCCLCRLLVRQLMFPLDVSCRM